MTSNAGEEKSLSTNLLGEWRGNAPQVIVLDFPPAELFPNRSKGKHWASLYKSRSNYREHSFFLTKSQLKNWKHQGKSIRLDLTFEMPDKRHRDIDNCLAASKSALDGVAEAIGVDDKMFNPICIFRKQGEKPGKLIVEIWSHS